LGEVEWHYQRELAEQLMYRIAGVISVGNSLHIKPKTHPEKDIKGRIEAAFQRLAAMDGQHVSVEAAGSEVTLRGDVRSWAEWEQAQTTAWAAPGVTHVINELTIRT
jgi:osmotically-inducible protein OsmY